MDFPHARWTRIVSDEDRSLLGRAARVAAAGAEPFYSAAIRLRNAAYERGWRAARRAHVPVISVGNLTTGGTGKTPMVIHIAERLAALGRRPAILLRGYKGSGPAGSDEQRVLAERLPGVPVIARPDRVAAADLLRREHPGADVILLDDGFQHRRLHRDLDLVLTDATNPFGYGRLLPRGSMREPPAALRRADAVLVTHAEALDEAGRDELARRLERFHGRPPLAWFDHVWERVVDEAGGPVEMSGRRVVPFCGIGNPGPFMDEVSCRMNPVAGRVFPDHHAYTAGDLRALEAAAAEHGAETLLTTEKDWAKLRVLLESHRPARPIWRVVLRLTAVRGAEALEKLLRRTFGAGCTAEGDCAATPEALDGTLSPTTAAQPETRKLKPETRHG